MAESVFTLKAGESLNRSAFGFTAYSAIIDNPSSAWYYLPEASQYIAPFQLGSVIPFPAGTRVVSLIARTPSGSVAVPVLEDQTVTIKVSDTALASSAGTLSPYGIGVYDSLIDQPYDQRGLVVSRVRASNNPRAWDVNIGTHPVDNLVTSGSPLEGGFAARLAAQAGTRRITHQAGWDPTFDVCGAAFVISPYDVTNIQSVDFMLGLRSGDEYELGIRVDVNGGGIFRLDSSGAWVAIGTMDPWWSTTGGPQEAGLMYAKVVGSIPPGGGAAVYTRALVNNQIFPVRGQLGRAVGAPGFSPRVAAMLDIVAVAGGGFIDLGESSITIGEPT